MFADRLDYIRRLFAPESDVLRQVRASAADDISIFPEEGKFLQLLIKLAGVKKIVEIGTLSGYSTTWMAEALSSDGKIWTIEKDENRATVARANLFPLPRAGEGQGEGIAGWQHDPSHFEKAKSLRKSSTDAEILFWQKVRNRQIEGCKFKRQVPIGNFYVDFLCPEKMLIVEIDGGQHGENEKDELRTQKLNELGYEVIRFWNNEVLENIEGVLSALTLTLSRKREREQNSKISLIKGDALQLLPTLNREGPFDMTFIDADKLNYLHYLDWAEKNVRKGGLIIGDNTFLFDAVWKDEPVERVRETARHAMREFNKRLSDPEKYLGIMLPTQEGMTVALKLF